MSLLTASLRVVVSLCIWQKYGGYLQQANANQHQGICNAICVTNILTEERVI